MTKAWTIHNGFRFRVFDHRPEPHPSSSSIIGKWKWGDGSFDKLDKDTRNRMLKKAGDIGTELHDLFEAGLKYLYCNGPKPDVPVKYQKLYGETMAWVKKQGVREVIGTEVEVYHPDYIYSGRFDALVVSKDGKTELWDWKTGDMREWVEVEGTAKKVPGRYDARMFVKAGEQLASYAKAYEAMNRGKIDRIVCINACRKTNKFETAVKYIHINYLFKGFLHRLEGWKHENFNMLRDGFKRPGDTTVYKWPLELILKDFYEDYLKEVHNV